MSTYQPVAAVYGDLDEALEAFESSWDHGLMPDVFEVLDQCPEDQYEEAASELIQIDLERRWRCEELAARHTVSHYLKKLPRPLPNALLQELVCWEYQIRNQWGDCVRLEHLYLKHRQLGKPLLKQLKDTAARIAWPVVSVNVQYETIVEARLDRVVNLGRQTSREAFPWSVTTSPQKHRVVLCEKSDASISREQLSIVLKSANAIVAKNESTGRAIAVRNGVTLNAGEQRVYQLPTDFHLGGTRYIRVARQKTIEV